jgi:hypothetical protein
MQPKPNVRPPVAGHPDTHQHPGSETSQNYSPVDLNAMSEDIARRMFREKGGESLMRDLRAIEGTLRMYEQDVERGMENDSPDKFRWRVSPGTATRLRKERTQVEAKLDKVLAECKAEAEKLVAELYPQQQAETPAYQADTEPAQPAAGAEKEAAPSAPTRGVA